LGAEATGIETVASSQPENAGAPVGLATEAVALPEDCGLGERQHDRDLVLVVILAETLEAVGAERQEITGAVALHEGPVLQHVVVGDVVALEHGVVAGEAQIEAGAVALAQAVAAAGVDVAAHLVAVLPHPVVVGLAGGVGIGDAAAELGQAEGPELAVLRIEHHARAGGEERAEDEVSIGCQVHEERSLDGEAELGVGAERGREEAGAPVDRGVGMVEIGRIEDRHAEELEPGIAVGDRAGRLIVHHPLGLDLPERVAAVLADLARAVDGTIEGGALAVAAHAPDGCQTTAVLEQYTDALDEPAAQTVVEHELVAEEGVARRLDQNDVAARGHGAGLDVVGDQVGQQGATVLQQLDIAARGDPAGLDRIDDFVGGQDQRCRADLCRLCRGSLHRQGHGKERQQQREYEGSRSQSRPPLTHAHRPARLRSLPLKAIWSARAHRCAPVPTNSMSAADRRDLRASGSRRRPRALSRPPHLACYHSAPRKRRESVDRSEPAYW
jgi:hypothetical protein